MDVVLVRALSRAFPHHGLAPCLCVHPTYGAESLNALNSWNNPVLEAFVESRGVTCLVLLKQTGLCCAVGVNPT